MKKSIRIFVITLTAILLISIIISSYSFIGVNYRFSDYPDYAVPLCHGECIRPRCPTIFDDNQMYALYGYGCDRSELIIEFFKLSGGISIVLLVIFIPIYLTTILIQRGQNYLVSKKLKK
jgi:hypothetical protein